MAAGDTILTGAPRGDLRSALSSVARSSVVLVRSDRQTRWPCPAPSSISIVLVQLAASVTLAPWRTRNAKDALMSLTTIVTLVTAVTSTAGLVFVGWSVRVLVRQMRIQSHQAIYAHQQEVDSLMFQRLDLKPIVEGRRPMPDAGDPSTKMSWRRWSYS